MDAVTSAAMQKAYQLIKTGQLDDALAILTPIIRAEPDNADAWYLLGFALADPEKRLYAFEQALRLDPSNQSAQKQLAKLHAASVVLPTTDAALARNAREAQKEMAVVLRWVSAVAALLVFCIVVVAIGVWLVLPNAFSVSAIAAASPTAAPTQLAVKSPAVPVNTASAVLSPASRSSVTPYPRRATGTPLPVLTSASIAEINLTLTSVAATPNMAVFADEKVGWQRMIPLIESKSGHLKAGESASIPLNIDSNLQVIVNFVWRGGQKAAFSIISPTGQVIDEKYARAHPSEVTYQAAKSDEYRLNKPVIGLWKLNIIASAVGNYEVGGSYASKPALQVQLGSDSYLRKNGDAITLAARVDENGVGIAGATITAINLENLLSQTVVFTDLGDGRYVAICHINNMIDFILPPNVTFLVAIKGKNHGVDFTRTAPFTVSLQRAVNSIITGYSKDYLGQKDGHTTLDVEILAVATDKTTATFSAKLLSNNKVISITSTEASLAAGDNYLTFQFSGDDIRFWRMDGPYTLMWTTVNNAENANNNPYLNAPNNIPFQKTAAYHWRDFGPELCFDLKTVIGPDPSAGSVAINPSPNCPNGQYLSATIVTLTANANAGFQFEKWVLDIDGVDSVIPTITFMLTKNTSVNSSFVSSP